jgi:hypothetical protein
VPTCAADLRQEGMGGETTAAECAQAIAAATVDRSSFYEQVFGIRAGISCGRRERPFDGNRMTKLLGVGQFASP